MASEFIASEKPLHVPHGLACLPPSWTWSRLDDACDGVFDCPHSTPRLVDEGPLVVRTQDIITGVFRTEHAAHVSEKTYQERIARAIPKRGDLLYSREGTYFGIAAEVPEDVRVCLGQRMVLIRPKASRIDFRFLRHWLNSPIMAAHIHGHRDGSVAERLNLPTIRALPVAVPPFTEQRAIAHILGTLDDKIELNRRRNQTLEAMARALFKDWFVDFGPVRARMEGRKPYLPREIWNLFPERLDDEGKPEGWEMQTVGDCFHLTMGQSPPGDTYNDVGDGLPFFQGRTDFEFRYPVNRKFCSAPIRVANVEDTLVSVRAPVGDINLAWEKCCVGRGVAGVRHISDGRSFTYHAIWSLQDELKQFEHTGTVFGAINKKQLEAIAFVEPSPDLIAAYENYAGRLDDAVRRHIEDSRTLAQLRDTLLPKLISGELRIADAERFLEKLS